MKLYDTLGREVAVLVHQEQASGKHAVTFSSNKFHLAGGVYYYTLANTSYSQTRKMVLIQ